MVDSQVPRRTPGAGQRRGGRDEGDAVAVRRGVGAQGLSTEGAGRPQKVDMPAPGEDAAFSYNVCRHSVEDSESIMIRQATWVPEFRTVRTRLVPREVSRVRTPVQAGTPGAPVRSQWRSCATPLMNADATFPADEPETTPG